MQVEGRKSEREKHFQKSSSSLPLHAQGRRSCTVLFKTAPKMSYDNHYHFIIFITITITTITTIIKKYFSIIY
jgi:hypothetical protein